MQFRLGLSIFRELEYDRSLSISSLERGKGRPGIRQAIQCLKLNSSSLCDCQTSERVFNNHSFNLVLRQSPLQILLSVYIHWKAAKSHRQPNPTETLPHKWAIYGIPKNCRAANQHLLLFVVCASQEGWELSCHRLPTDSKLFPSGRNSALSSTGQRAKECFCSFEVNTCTTDRKGNLSRKTARSLNQLRNLRELSKARYNQQADTNKFVTGKYSENRDTRSQAKLASWVGRKRHPVFGRL